LIAGVVLNRIEAVTPYGRDVLLRAKEGDCGVSHSMQDLLLDYLRVELVIFRIHAFTHPQGKALLSLS